ncbi:hypothetical protein [Pelomonas sp. KK5]|uniref:hypothetical protein n=1 Tax=Pelomonas sp. KK5 TaxID=1855730 RepID=UPI00097CA058|nr:hypothetical protein [Pelomonas sp. KK5]
MNKQATTLFAAIAAVLFAGAAHAAPQTIEKLPTVVITGKAVKPQQQQVVQLPTVVVTGYSIEGQLRRQMLAQAAAAKAARRG